MQQTTSREFSIIESSDPFLPEALNDNTRKIEAALDAHETQTKAVTDALDARITTLEGHKMAWGLYTGDGQASRLIPLPFTPTVVVAHNLGTKTTIVGIEGQTSGPVATAENGLLVRYSVHDTNGPNVTSYYYLYVAFS